MSKNYQYRYTTATGEPLTICPECGYKLVEPGGVLLEVVCGGKSLEYSTFLHTDGRLEDVDGLVACGYHSATFCWDCCGILIDMDDVVEEEHDDAT